MNIEASIKRPTIPLTNPRFQYINAAATDVTLTWRKHGWTPPSDKLVMRSDVEGFGPPPTDGLTIFSTNGVERGLA